MTESPVLGFPAEIYTGHRIGLDVGMEEFAATHNGNADRFASLHLGQVLLSSSGRQQSFYSLDSYNRWLLNEGDTAGDVERRARDVIVKTRARALALRLADEDDKRAAALLKWTYTCDNLASMQMMAKAACLTYGMVCQGEESFDNRCDILATPTRLLELHDDGSVTERAIQPEDRVTMSTSVEYRPEILDNPPELVTQYLATFIPEPEKQRALFTALGSALFGGNSHRLLVILQGKVGTNGKTQLVEAIRKTMGSYAGIGNPTIFRGNMEEKPRPDILGLLHKRFALLAEADKNWELHGDRVKALTGGDGLKVRSLFGKYVEVMPHFTPIIYTNNMPRITRADQATRRRMLVFDFPHSPTEEDVTIKTRFLGSESVMEWILAALVHGYRESVVSGVSDVLRAFSVVSEKAFRETTHLGEFFEWLDDHAQLRQITEEEAGEWGVKSRFVTLKFLHERYVYWINQHGSRQDKTDTLSYREFNDQLRNTYGFTSIKVAGARWDRMILSEVPPG